MANGFMQRFKGRIKAVGIWLGSSGLVDSATGNTIISGLNLNVGNVQMDGAFGNSSITTGITAGPTHSIAGAVLLPSAVNVVSTVATLADAVKLPALQAVAGNEVALFNQGASLCTVYPYEATTPIDQGTTGAAVSLTANHAAFFIQITPTSWASVAAAKSS